MNQKQWRYAINEAPRETPSVDAIHDDLETMVGQGRFSVERVKDLVWALAHNPDLTACVLGLAERTYADYVEEMNSLEVSA